MCRYEPSVRLYIQQFIDVNFDGYVSWTGDTKYSSALRISGFSRNPIKISGNQQTIYIFLTCTQITNRALLTITNHY